MQPAKKHAQGKPYTLIAWSRTPGEEELTERKNKQRWKKQEAIIWVFI